MRPPAASEDDQPCATAGFRSPSAPVFVLNVTNPPCSDAVCSDLVCGILIDDAHAGIEDDKAGTNYIADDTPCP
jgi:hypothetical protein